MPVSKEAFQAYREVFRSLGPKHRLIDRWRYDLGWNVPDTVIANWVADERAKLVSDGKGPH